MAPLFRWTVGVLLLVLAGPWAGAGAQVAAAAPQSEPGRRPGATPPPNLVVLFADDLGYGDLGCQGAAGFSTPHLDQLAAEGTRFTDFYVAAPVCTPSRAALLTGCHPRRVGLGYRVLFPYSETGLHPDEVTLAEVLQPAGYRSACVGKWHLGHHPEFLPLRQGFDEWFGVPYSNDMDRHHYKAREFQAPPLPLYRGEEIVEESPDQALLTQRYTDAAVDFIARHSERPFFLYLPYTMPHLPIAASEQFRGRSELGLYGDVIEEIDASVGRILAALSDSGVAERTVVLFSSDNGPWRRESAGGLRGKKNTTWEGGMRVPCLLRWPGRVPAGRVCRAPWSAEDLLPSFARLAGAALPPGRRLDGRDRSTMWLGEPERLSPEPVFSFYRDDRLQAVRRGRWKLHVLRPEWQGEAHAPLLFDMETDPGEQRDLAAEEPERVAGLLEVVEDFRRELGDAATRAPGRELRPAGKAPGARRR